MSKRGKNVSLSGSAKLARLNLSQLSPTLRRDILSILNDQLIKKQFDSPIPKFSGKCSYIIPLPKVEIGKLPYKKKDFRAILIIYLLSDGQKHNQTEIMTLSNSLHDEIISKGANAPIFEKIGWCGEIILGVMHSGHFNDGSVNRTVDYLEKTGIIERKAIKTGRGAYPVYNWLKKDPLTFLKLLEFLKSGSWDDEIFLLLGGYLVNSPYGEEVINEESIGEILEVLGGGYDYDEKQMVLRIVKISPSALLGLLELYRDFNSDLRVWSLEEKKEFRERIFNDLGIKLGEDLRNPSFRNLNPIQYEIKVHFIEQINDHQEKECIVDKNRLEIRILKR